MGDSKQRGSHQQGAGSGAFSTSIPNHVETLSPPNGPSPPLPRHSLAWTPWSSRQHQDRQSRQRGLVVRNRVLRLLVQGPWFVHSGDSPIHTPKAAIRTRTDRTKSLERYIPELNHVLALRDGKPLKITTQPGILPLLFQTQHAPFPFAFGI